MNGSTLWELAGGWGLRYDFKPHSPFIPVKKPSGRIVPETSYNPLKELSVKTCSVPVAWERAKNGQTPPEF